MRAEFIFRAAVRACPGYVIVDHALEVFLAACAEFIFRAAVRACPGYVIAGHAPEIFLHAGLAESKVALATGPSKIKLLLASDAWWIDALSATTTLRRRRGFVGHGERSLIWESWSLSRAGYNEPVACR